jgi:hypothetical protein
LIDKGPAYRCGNRNFPDGRPKTPNVRGYSSFGWRNPVNRVAKTFKKLHLSRELDMKINIVGAYAIAIVSCSGPALAKHDRDNGCKDHMSKTSIHVDDRIQPAH